MNIEFNKDTFFIGAATSACQIEGGYDKDGRTPSIWDVAPEKKVANGDNCHHACEHYSHYKEDVTLMKKIGLFAGGVLFGTAGVKLLSSKDAKKVYTECTAAALRAKDCVMKTVTNVQENAEDILAEAQQINEERAAQEAAAVQETEEDGADLSDEGTTQRS